MRIGTTSNEASLNSNKYLYSSYTASKPPIDIMLINWSWFNNKVSTAETYHRVAAATTGFFSSFKIIEANTYLNMTLSKTNE